MSLTPEQIWGLGAAENEADRAEDIAPLVTYVECLILEAKLDYLDKGANWSEEDYRKHRAELESELEGVKHGAK